jgi:predicted glycosyltransferase involved in capsule biosynthesis
MELSFCITCMNRTNYLKKTLLKNLIDNKNSKVEFILVNFNSVDGLENYINNNNEIKKYLVTKQLKYFNYEKLKYWHSSIAKNIAHNYASGNILVNLDCDNFIGENGGDFIINYFKQLGNNIILSQSKEIFGSGTAGRISILKNNFKKLGGYNEYFFPMGYQDTDLIERAKKINLKHINISKNNDAIVNNKKESLINCDTNIDYITMENCNKLISKINLENNEYVANKYLLI